MPRAHTSPSLPIRLIPLLLWAAALAYLSLAPSVRAPSGLLGWDKLNHFAAYAVLAALLLFTLAARVTLGGRMLLVAWFTAFGYGLLLEALQGAMAVGRRWELFDLSANGLGALTACLLCVLLRHVMKLPSHS